MTMDVYNSISGISALAPGAARTTSANGATIDRTSLNGGNNGVAFLVHAGTITDGTHTFSLQDSPDSTTWTAVASPYVQTPATTAFTSSTTSGTVLKFGYMGVQQYVRLISTVTGSPATGGYYSAIAAEWFAGNEPAS